MSIESITQAASAQGKSGSALSSLSGDLDNFLKILTTQLTNQDPLSPMETNEFTNQLVSFANVEQNIAQSGLLEDLIALQKSGEASNAANYMGKTVTVDHNEFTFQEGSTKTLEFTLPEEAKTAAIFVMDDDGNVIYSAPVDEAQGKNSFAWDGLQNTGASFPTGNYFFEVKAVNADDIEIDEIKYSYAGEVNAVNYGDGKTNLLLGDVSIDLGKVTGVVSATN